MTPEIQNMADLEKLRAFANATVSYWQSTDDLDDFHDFGMMLFLKYGLVEDDGFTKTSLLTGTSESRPDAD